MDLADLNRAFYNVLGQFQAEKLYVDGIDTAVRSHADDLDGFNKQTQKMSSEVEDLELRHEHMKSVVESNFEQTYERIKNGTWSR